MARAVSEGRNNTETAAALYISHKTVEAHLTRVYRKLGVRSRNGLARYFLATWSRGCFRVAPEGPHSGPGAPRPK